MHFVNFEIDDLNLAEDSGSALYRKLTRDLFLCHRMHIINQYEFDETRVHNSTPLSDEMTISTDSDTLTLNIYF